jgi:hypothetical protein
MKSTLLLATGLFLVSAPAPDARDIAEMTVNFIVLQHVPGTLASEEPIDQGAERLRPARKATAMATVPVPAEQEEPLTSPAG